MISTTGLFIVAVIMCVFALVARHIAKQADQEKSKNHH